MAVAIRYYDSYTRHMLPREYSGTRAMRDVTPLAHVLDADAHQESPEEEEEE